MDGRKRKGDRPDIRPSDKVKRCLFGKADNREKEEESRRNVEETLSYLEKMKMKYDYDFVKEKHLKLENTPYSVAIIIETSDEKDSAGESSSIPVANVESHELATTTPSKLCLADYAENDSESKLSNESVKATSRTQTEEGNRACDTDKAFLKLDKQSKI